MKCAALILLALAAAFRPGALSAAGRTFALRAGTYNIRCIASSDTGDRAWNSRKASLASLVEAVGFDVVGFQEVREDQKTWLASNLSGYVFFAGTKRSSDSGAEYLPVAYDSSRFDRLDGGTFWLSDTPDKMSKFAASQLYRICTWVLLRDKETQGRVVFANVHLDLAEEARLAQMRVVLDFLKPHVAGGANAIVAGDMNCYETESTIGEALGMLRDAALEAGTVSGPWRTFNGWSYKDPATEPTTEYALTLPVSARNPLDGGKRIDFIFVSPSGEVRSYAVVNDTQPGKETYPSDHNPVCADLTLLVKNIVAKGRFTVKVTADCHRVAGARRFVLTEGAGLEDAENIDFDLPGWVERAAVENGEIVIYTKPNPFSIRLR